MYYRWDEIDLEIETRYTSYDAITFVRYMNEGDTEIQRIILRNIEIYGEGDPLVLRIRHIQLHGQKPFVFWRLNESLWSIAKHVLLFLRAMRTNPYMSRHDMESLELFWVVLKSKLRELDKREGDTTTMKSDSIYKLIEAADKCRREIVLCLLGKPGIGKTEAVERFAKDNGRNVVHIIASQILPSEVSGMTMPNQETHSMDVFDHFRLSHMKDGDILFFDELLKGQQQVLNACLTLVQERRLMSGTKLPDVLVIAAANPLATPTQLPLEIRQRFMFVNVKWDPEEWVDYMKEHGFANKSLELQQLANEISKNMEKDDTWNKLTPRTATKLCQWLKSIGSQNVDESESVARYIRESFGVFTLQIIGDVVRDSNRITSCKQVAEKIIEMVGPHTYDEEDRIVEEPYKDEAVDIARKIINGESDDMSELMQTLTKLDEWEEIKKALEECSIDDNISY